MPTPSPSLPGPVPPPRGADDDVAGVLVLDDGGSAQVLAAVRSLGAAGYRVGVGSPTPDAPVVASRWCAAWHEVRLPDVDLDAFVADVGTAVSEAGYAVVLASGDAELLALSLRRDEIPALVPHAPHEAVLHAVDKLHLVRAAEQVGLAAPRTVVATAPELARVDLPVVVKARLHWTAGSAPHTARHLPAALCVTRSDAAACVAAIERGGGTGLLQSPIAGEQIALSVVVDAEGEPAAWSQQRTVLPSASGASVRAETTEVDPDLLDAVMRLLRRTGWSGLANLQFLRPPGGRPQVIDLNGRLYGSLALAVAAGADLPAVWVGLALGRPVPRPQVARAGVRFHALRQDLARARRRPPVSVVPDILRSLVYAPGAVHSTWEQHDPRPAARLASGMAGRALGRGRPGVGS